MAAALFAAGGLGEVLSAFLPAEPAYWRPGVMGVGMAAMVIAGVVWGIRWERWPPRASLVLVPIAFAMIAIGNHFAAGEPFRYAIYFVVVFVWIGFAHPPGTSLAFTPLLVVAYLLPLFTAGVATPMSVSSIVHVVPICVAVGESMAWISSRLRAAEAQLQRAASEARFRSLVQNASDVILVIDGRGTILYETPSVEKVLGYRPEARVGASAFDHVHPDDVAGARAAFEGVLGTPEAEHHFEFRIRHADGSWRAMHVIAKNLVDDENVRGVLINLRDVTETLQLEAELRHQASHDVLTGLANRALFTDRLEHALRRTARYGGSVAVLFLDLDDFKTVNDSLGHATGDRLLQAVGRRLTGTLREADTTARLGGDEFGILIEEADDGGVVQLAERILERLREPLKVGRRRLVVSASIGIAIGGRHHSAMSLLRNADVAMYRAKDLGKGRVALFRPEMQRAAADRFALRDDLERALEQREFLLRYQPLVDLDSGQVVAAEALVRWNHPRRGLLQPDDFIGLAEETGLIRPLGLWVLEEACRQTRAWTEEGARERPLPVTINLSAKQLEQADLVDDIRRVLAANRLDAQVLTLEITETVLMSDTGVTGRALAALKSLGVRIMIDDFGTGYSSLNYLRRFPIDGLKIDRAFVAALENGREEAALVGSILGLGRSLRLETVAEGIERSEQLARLRGLGCKVGQGYLFSPPVPPDELLGLRWDGPIELAASA